MRYRAVTVLGALALCLAPVRGQADEMLAMAKAQRAIREDFFNPLTHVRLAYLYHQAGADVMAFRLLYHAQTRHFTPAEFLGAFQEVFHPDRQVEELVAPEERLRRAREEARAHPDSASAQLTLARACLQVDADLTGATAALDQAIHLDPGSGEARALRATVFLRQGKAAEARAGLQEFLAEHPGDEHVAMRLADLEKGTSLSKALAVVREALQHNPGSARLHFALAYLGHGQLDAVDQATAFRKALELDPDNAVMRAWFARFLATRDLREEALAEYLRAWFQDPTVQDVQPAYRSITSLLEDGAASVLATVRTPTEALRKLRGANPVVILGSWALVRQQEGLDREVLETAFQQLAHDDEAVRYQAAMFVAERAPPGMDGRIRELLGSQEPFVRGVACYIIARRFPEQAIELLEPLLRESNEYLRFEALSALVEEGSSRSRQVVLDHMATETSPRLQRVFGRFR